MSLKIEKLLSQQSLPLSKYNNIINFVIPEEGSHMDFIQSYIMFNLPVSSTTSQRLSFGRSNQAYYPVCLVRRSRLISSKKGLLTEVNNLNLLVNNLLWTNKTTSENLSDSLWGWGATEGLDYVHSVFTDNPANPYVKIPFAHLFPGSLSNTSKLSIQELGELTIQLELEPTKNLFQQVVAERWNLVYGGQNAYKGNYSCDDVGENASAVLTLSNNKTATALQVGDNLLLNYTDANEDVQQEDVIIQAISQDLTQITLNSEVPAGSTLISVDFNNVLIHCNKFVGTGAPVSTLTIPATNLTFNDVVQQFNGTVQDITAGPLPLAVEIDFFTFVSADGTDLTPDSTTTSITNVVVNQDKTITLTFAPNTKLNVANTKTVAGIQLRPLNVNVDDAQWSVQEAYCFPYRYLNMPDEERGQLLLTHYTYEPLPFVSDGSTFAREIMTEPNTTNCILLMPPADDTSQLYSTVDGVQNYRFFLNDMALSNIPLVVSDTTDLDMRQRVFNNSEFPTRNLNAYKNAPNYTGTYPEPYCAKIKPHIFNGMPNFDEGDMIKKPLRVEINGNNMPATKTIYFFKEVMKVV